MKQKAVVISPRDNVATALAELKAGDSVDWEINGKSHVLKLINDVPFGHKFCLCRIEAGAPVIKYGEVMGVSTKTIKPGEHVHIHNVVSTRGRGDLEKDER